MAQQTDFHLVYDRLWRSRMEVMKGFIDQGAETPFEVIRRLKALEIDQTMMTDGSFQKSEIVEGVELLPTGMPMFRALPVAGEIVPAPFHDDHIDFLLHFIAQHEFDAIVELGSGYGRNIIELYSRGGPKNVPYFAGEITEGGREAAETLFAMLPRMKVVSFPFDHKAPDLSVLAGFNKVLLFSYHSIEQVTALDDEYFVPLVEAAPQVTGIHMEPFGYQLAKYDGEPSRLQRNFFSERGWNSNFAKVMLAAHTAGTIKITFVDKEVFGGEPYNPTSLMTWVKP